MDWTAPILDKIILQATSPEPLCPSWRQQRAAWGKWDFLRKIQSYTTFFLCGDASECPNWKAAFHTHFECSVCEPKLFNIVSFVLLKLTQLVCFSLRALWKTLDANFLWPLDLHSDDMKLLVTCHSAFQKCYQIIWWLLPHLSVIIIIIINSFCVHFSSAVETQGWRVSSHISCALVLGDRASTVNSKFFCCFDFSGN